MKNNNVVAMTKEEMLKELEALRAENETLKAEKERAEAVSKDWHEAWKKEYDFYHSGVVDTLLCDILNVGGYCDIQKMIDIQAGFGVDFESGDLADYGVTIPSSTPLCNPLIDIMYWRVKDKLRKDLEDEYIYTDEQIDKVVDDMIDTEINAMCSDIYFNGECYDNYESLREDVINYLKKEDEDVDE